MPQFVSLYFRFKLDINANLTMQNGEWMFIRAFFSVINSFDTHKRKPIYLLLHNAVWLPHAFSQWYIETKLLFSLALSPRVHYQVFWLLNLLMTCQLIGFNQPKTFWRQLNLQHGNTTKNTHFIHNNFWDSLTFQVIL